MFIFHTSNKTENLFLHLAKVLAAQPLSSPFTKELFLIQSQGMERWLSQQLAAQMFVWGNFEFLFPGTFFSKLAQRIDSHLSDEFFQRDKMIWRFEALLRDIQGEVFAPLFHYLSGENSALKRFQLARQLAQVFDQYQIMRPEMLEAWLQQRNLSDNPAVAWQQALWRQLLNNTGERHRGALWLAAIDKLKQAEPGCFAELLPERVSIFGLNTMPPLFLEFLQGLARHCQVHFYLLNPAQYYWADLETTRQRLKKSLRQPATEEIFPPGNPLLAALGQQGREFQEMLLEQVDFELQLESFEAPADVTKLTVLQQLQQDILNNEVSSLALHKDHSISIHACYSRMREVQVLKDQLLQALENNPALQLRDIVVMAPDIQQYAPFISAVFDDVQHAVADRSLRLSNSLLDNFVRFLQLGQSRLGWQCVLDLLEQPAIYGSFDLSETDLALLRHWIVETGIRWGRSGAHKQQLDLPPLEGNTWRAGLDRLLLGYAVAEGEGFVNGILPYTGIEGSSAQALGGLYDFLQLLFDAGDALQAPKSLKDWSVKLHGYAGQLFSAATIADAERQQLNDIFNELAFDLAAVHQQQVTLDVIIAWLQNTLDERKSTSGFLRGQLTFCSMLPMRSIPFKIIALMGMNEAEFPRIDRYPTFDLLGHDFRKGDRSRRADDRYQFLEILLSAREQLLLTYIGQSIRQNEAIPPSVIISELAEVLAENYQIRDIVIRHPLQAFNRRYFSRTSELFSFSANDLATAQALLRQPDTAAQWWQGEIPAEQATGIDLNDFFAFFKHPQHYFLQRRLGLKIQAITEANEEREPFAVDSLDAYLIQQQWVTEQLAGGDLSVARLQAEGRWPQAASGDIAFAAEQQSISEFAATIKNKQLGQRLPAMAIDLPVCGCRLLGKLGNRYEKGLLFYRYARLQGCDLLMAWLHHLIINQIQPVQTYLLSRDEDLIFLPEWADAESLAAFIEIFLQGQTRPDVFFTSAALTYVKQSFALKQGGGRAKKSAIDAVLQKLENDISRGYEPAMTQLFGGCAELSGILHADFEVNCQQYLQAIWEKSHGV